jgi:cell division protein FtsW
LHQLILGFLPAIILGFVAYKVPLEWFKKWSVVFVCCNLIAVFLVFIPHLGVNAGGASRWLNLRFFSFQPSEILKITSILYLASWIASKLSSETARDWKQTLQNTWHNVLYILLPFLVFLGAISMALMLQKDASTLGIISLTLLAMYFSAKTPLWHSGLIVIMGATALLLLVKFEPYRLARWTVFLDPNNDPLGKGFQLKQSMIAIGSGGFWGKGLGMSIEKFGYLPQAMSDSIFAVIGEEIGFIGCVVLVALFVALFLIGIYIYRNSRDTFSKLTAIGIVFWISLQAFINMASSAGIFPLAGVPLPFFSYGGTHLVVELIGIGILLNIAKQV